ncbi:Tetratricopeptide repeat protein 37 [Trichinella pseudospiralis]|uniref:Tetratricopeptide repeat protein 37 n=1 Tax=Trichinella pseudospiralis TaxID=6337 RepID=A0A0V1FEL3_TRIPS|nr:Tetratricopeptide repeat protein 37 [Trichinella pseudospiralis]
MKMAKDKDKKTRKPNKNTFNKNTAKENRKAVSKCEGTANSSAQNRPNVVIDQPPRVMDQKEEKALLKTAKAMYKEKQYNQCLEICKTILNCNAKCYFGFLLSGLCYIFLNEYTEAKKCLKAAVEIQPDDVSGWKGLEMYYDTFNFNDIFYVEVLRKLIQVEKDNRKERTLKLFKSLDNLGKTEEALSELFAYLGDVNDESEVINDWANDIFKALSSKGCLSEDGIQSIQFQVVNSYEIMLKKDLVSFDAQLKYAEFCQKHFLTKNALIEGLALRQRNDKDLEFSIQLFRLMGHAYIDVMSDEMDIDTSIIDKCEEYLFDNFDNMTVRRNDVGFVFMALIESLREINDFRYDKAIEILNVIFRGVENNDINMIRFGERSIYSHLPALCDVKKKYIPYRFEIGIFLTEAYLLKHDYSGAQEVAEEVVELNLGLNTRPGYYILRLHLAEIYRELQLNYEKAKEICNQILSQNNLSLSERIKQRAKTCLALLHAQDGEAASGLELLIQDESCYEVHCARAQCYLLMGKLQEASAEATAATELNHDDDAQAHYLMGETLRLIGEQPNEALTELLQACKLNAYSAPAFFSLGQLLWLTEGPTKKALECFKWAVHLRPYDRVIVRALSDRYASLGMNDENMDLLERSADYRQFEPWTWAWREFGMYQLLEANNLTKAVKAFQRLCPSPAEVTEDGDLVSLDLLAESYYRQGNSPTASRIWKQYCKFKPDLYRLMRLGDALQKSRRFEEALETYSCIDEEHWAPLYGTGHTYVYKARVNENAGRFQVAFRSWCAAIQPLERAFQLKPSALLVEKTLADAQFAMAVYKQPNPILWASKAWQHYLKCWSRIGRYPAVICGQLARSMGDVATYLCNTPDNDLDDQLRKVGRPALKALRRATRLEPDDISNWIAFGVAAARLRKPRLAQHCFIKAILLDKENPQGWTNLGVLYLEHKNYDLAYECFHTAQNMSATYGHSWYGMGLLSEIVKQPDKTLDIFKESCHLTLQRSIIYNYGLRFCEDLVECIKEHGHADCINMKELLFLVEILPPVICLFYSNPMTLNNLGILLEFQGDHAGAYKAYNDSLALMNSSDCDWKEERVVVKTNLFRLAGLSRIIAGIYEPDDEAAEGNLPLRYALLAGHSWRRSRVEGTCENFENLTIFSENSVQKTLGIFGKHLLMDDITADHCVEWLAELNLDEMLPVCLVNLLWYLFQTDMPFEEVLTRAMNQLSKFSKSLKKAFFYVLYLYRTKLSTTFLHSLFAAAMNESWVKMILLDFLDETMQLKLENLVAFRNTIWKEEPNPLILQYVVEKSKALGDPKWEIWKHRFLFLYPNFAEQLCIEDDKKVKFVTASAGNRTRVARVAGEHSTTEPPTRCLVSKAGRENTELCFVVGLFSCSCLLRSLQVVHLPACWSIVQLLFFTVILQLTNGQVESEENLTNTIKRSSSFFGIPVPGNSISGTDVLQLYVRSCKPGFEELPQGDILSSTIKMLADGHGEQFLQKMYSDLFFAIQSIDANKLEGKWYRVMDSSGFYDEICSVVDIKIIEQSQYIATFSVKELYRPNGPNGTVVTSRGQAFKMGPDPGGFLYFTGRQEDVCPYFIVKTGALNNEQKYEYVILSQLFKTPVIVLAKDPQRFALQYKNEVNNFFKQNDFAKSPWDNDNTAALSHFDHVNCVSSYDDF